MAFVTIDPEAYQSSDFEAAAAWLRSGGVVAFPTDTLYGLAADPESASAVAAVFDLKGRGSDAALPLVAASVEQVEAWCGRALTGGSATLARTFWPGPLSLVLEAPDRVAPAVHGGRGTVAIRVPDSGIARSLAAVFGRPVTATSANRSGERAAVRAVDLGGLGDDRRVLVIDGGPAPGGAPSTLVDARDTVPTLIREGAVPWNRVLKSLQE